MRTVCDNGPFHVDGVFVGVPPSTGSLFKIHIYFIACDLFKLRFNYPPFVYVHVPCHPLQNENYQF